jgi:hypothetical protein
VVRLRAPGESGDHRPDFYINRALSVIFTHDMCASWYGYATLRANIASALCYGDNKTSWRTQIRSSQKSKVGEP